MKKIKLLSLLLAVLMLTGVAALFSSCAGSAGEIKPSKKTVDVDLTGYAVLYGDSQSGFSFTSAVRDQFDKVTDALNAATGINFKMTQASRSEPNSEAKEILLGATNRKESEKALSSIKKDGFVIKVTENKIVIVGTNNLYTMMAMDYFVQNYLTGKERSKTVTFNESVKANKMASVVLGDSTTKSGDLSNAYNYVYSDDLARFPSAYFNANYDVSTPYYEEYPQLAARTIADKMSGVVKLATENFPLVKDTESTSKEVLIGHTSREESTTALSEINETQYIIAVRGERVVINAHSNYVLSQAADAYINLLKEATVKDEDGNVKVVLPVGFRMIGDAEHNWVTDFPKPEGEGITLSNAMDNNDDALQYLYTGTGVNRAAFDAYCKTLEAAGYKASQTTTVDGSDSVFKFYTNKTRNIALYVAYNAYSYKDTYGEFDWTVSKKVDSQIVDPYGFETNIRIVSSTVENAYFPEASLLNKSYVEPLTKTTITSMPIYSNAVGACFVITLEDGRFIVLDGGSINAGSREYDTLYTLLSTLNEQVTGQKTSKDNPIRIAAWVLSHAHIDHYYAFKKMISVYGKTGTISMQYMISNTPSAKAYLYESFDEVTEEASPDAIKAMQNNITGGFKVIKPHTGMSFYIGNVKFDTMVTWEDLSPWQCPNTNDTNTVFRLTISGDSNDETTTMMWLGDANRLQSRFMCATFGTNLKSDISTVAHHGNSGAEVDLYEMIDPETLLWTHHAGAVEDYLTPAHKTKGWQYEVDQYFAYEMESVKRIFTAGAKMFFTSSDTTSDSAMTGRGLKPAGYGYVQLSFDGGAVQYDDVQEICISFEQQSDKSWKATGWNTRTLAHTDISAGSKGFVANTNIMTFVSNYMVKCDKACPTGAHTH